MARFSAIAAVAKGTKARKVGVECTTLDGRPFTCDLRLLSADEEARILDEAVKRAKAGGSDGKESDLAYQFAWACGCVALAAVDPESQEDAPVAFFDGGVEQVRTHLDRERILLLAETQRRFQEQASPRCYDLSVDDQIKVIAAIAASEEGEDLPFENWPRSTLNSLIRFMAVQLSIVPAAKSPTSSGGVREATH